MGDKIQETASSKSDENEVNDNVSANTPVFAGPSLMATIPLPSRNRNRTDAIQFRVRGSTITAASPPMFISLEEIMKAAHGVQDMSLAHEIAIDDEFRLEPFEPPDNSYQKLVKDTMHKAFFDILREELNSDPPIFRQALVLLEDVKEGLFSIIMPHHVKIRQMIEEILDQAFIRQQAEAGAIDFKKYSDFVVDLMAKLAAPVRDEMIQNISKLEDTVDIFSAILETLEVLKLDLANTLIAMIRPHVQAQSVQYEQEKFKQFLEVQDDGLANTKKWLASHIDKSIPKPLESDGIFLRNTTSQTLAKAYLQLLDWDESQTYPETVVMDASRFADLGQSVYRLITSSCVLLVSPSCSAATETTALQFKTDLKNKIVILMQGVKNDKDFEILLPSLAAQVIADTDKFLKSLKQEPLNDQAKELINGQILGLKDPEHKVRQLVRQRVYEFLKEILVCGGGSKQVPVGLSSFSQELTSLAGTLLRLVMHNKAVFSQYYPEIVASELDKQHE